VFRRNAQGQWVLSEYTLADQFCFESLNVEIAIADLYQQVTFESETPE
jgi:phage terminase large subunit